MGPLLLVVALVFGVNQSIDQSLIKFTCKRAAWAHIKDEVSSIRYEPCVCESLPHISGGTPSESS